MLCMALRMNGTGVNDKKCMQFSAAVNMVIINSWRLLALIINFAYVNITARMCVVMRGYLSLKWFAVEFKQGFIIIYVFIEIVEL